MVYPERNLAISFLYNMNDEFFTNKALMYEIPTNVSKIISGMGSGSVAHGMYWGRHIALDILYILLIVFSGLLLWKAIKWKSSSKSKVGQWSMILVMNMVFPTFLLNFVRLFFNTPLWVVKSYVNDFWWVLVISATLAYLGGIVKVYKMCLKKG